MGCFRNLSVFHGVGGVVLISEKPVFYLIHCYMLKESGCEKFN